MHHNHAVEDTLEGDKDMFEGGKLQVEDKGTLAEGTLAVGTLVEHMPVVDRLLVEDMQGLVDTHPHHKDLLEGRVHKQGDVLPDVKVERTLVVLSRWKSSYFPSMKRNQVQGKLVWYKSSNLECQL